MPGRAAQRAGPAQKKTAGIPGGLDLLRRACRFTAPRRILRQS